MLRPLAALLCLLAFAGMADAACYADYKAKQDQPLRLHYGVIQLTQGACADPGRAEAEIAARIGRAGWRLLTVMSRFDDSGLAERKDSAGVYYLRY